MTVAALALILAAAVMHATWNLLAKQSRGGAEFVWLFELFSILIYAPFAIAILVIGRPHIDTPILLFMAGTSVLHLAYFIALQRGYRAGDLSLVYPLARGTGPLLSTTAAILFFGERPTPIALAAVLLIIGGVVLLTIGSRSWKGAKARPAVAYGLLTGLIIAAYTLWDKHAVSVLLIPPLLYDWAGQIGQVALLSPFAIRHWATVRAEWRANRRAVLGVAALSPLAYILVLTALVFTPVSYVAPAREVSILIGTIMGARLLSEGEARRRLVAGSAIVLGILALVIQ